MLLNHNLSTNFIPSKVHPHHVAHHSKCQIAPILILCTIMSHEPSKSAQSGISRVKMIKPSQLNETKAHFIGSSSNHFKLTCCSN